LAGWLIATLACSGILESPGENVFASVKQAPEKRDFFSGRRIFRHGRSREKNGLGKTAGFDFMKCLNETFPPLEQLPANTIHPEQFCFD
jgi:hypothetical protein